MQRRTFGGIVGLVLAAAATVTGSNYLRNSNLYYDSDGKPYTFHTKASPYNDLSDFVSPTTLAVNTNSATVSTKSIKKQEYATTYNPQQKTFTVEIPSLEENTSHTSYEDRFTTYKPVFAIDLTQPHNVGQDGVISHHSWLEFDVYDNDGLRTVEVYETDPITHRATRHMLLGEGYAQLIRESPTRKFFAIEFDQHGVGSATMAIVRVTDFNGNEYSTSLRFERKVDAAKTL